MIHQRTHGLHSLVVLAQIAATLLLYALMVLAFHHTRGLVGVGRYVLYGGLVAVALVIESLQRDRSLIRTSLFERGLLKLHRIALRQTIAVLIALGLLAALLKDPVLSRVFLVSFLAALYPLLLVTSKHLPRWLASGIFRGIREQKTLLVGSSTIVPRLVPWLDNRKEFGVQTVGILCDEITPDTILGLPVLGGSDEIERVIRETGVSQVIVLGLSLLLHSYSHVISICNRHGVRLVVLSDLEERLRHPVIHVDDDGLQFITLRQEPLENPLNRATKRFLDIAISLPITVCVLPFISAVVWASQRLQSPGPLFYLQTRAGIQNRHFQIYKYRTMHHADNRDEAKQATHGDARIYPAGRWWRKLSIDELPQFVNVLRGEMSIVGPRPHLIQHNQEFATLLASYHIRAFVRPGITGLAQVRGHRGEATTHEAIASRLASDTEYLENWSLFLELGIIARTAWQMVFPPKTAY